MIRGGRVSPLKGLLARSLNLKPIVSLDREGAGIAFSKAYSISSVEKKILKLIKEIHDKDKISVFSIVHSLDIERAKKMADMVEGIIGIKPLFISEVSSVVGISSVINLTDSFTSSSLIFLTVRLCDFLKATMTLNRIFRRYTLRTTGM